MAKTDNDGRIKQWIINPNGDFQNLESIKIVARIIINHGII